MWLLELQSHHVTRIRAHVLQIPAATLARLQTKYYPVRVRVDICFFTNLHPGTKHQKNTRATVRREDDGTLEDTAALGEVVTLVFLKFLIPLFVSSGVFRRPPFRFEQQQQPFSGPSFALSRRTNSVLFISHAPHKHSQMQRSDGGDRARKKTKQTSRKDASPRRTCARAQEFSRPMPYRRAHASPCLISFFAQKKTQQAHTWHRGGNFVRVSMYSHRREGTRRKTNTAWGGIRREGEGTEGKRKKGGHLSRPGRN